MVSNNLHALNKLLQCKIIIFNTFGIVISPKIWLVENEEVQYYIENGMTLE